MQNPILPHILNCIGVANKNFYERPKIVIQTLEVFSLWMKSGLNVQGGIRNYQDSKSLKHKRDIYNSDSRWSRH